MRTIRLARPEDAAAYARCHVDCLAETYVEIMPPAFAEQQRAELDDYMAELTDELTAMHVALASGHRPKRTHWLAIEPDPIAPAEGEQVVGVVSSGPGINDWEREHFDNPAPAVETNLDHLYTRRHTHGTGLGQALLDTALPGQEPAWLWVLHDNPRAEAFYRRNGFLPDGLEVLCGPAWFNRPMYRMHRC